MALAPVKVVLKSTTTKTLNDRFTEMMRHKGPRQSNREEMAANHRASAKNRRLAEQMSRRTGINPKTTSAAMDREDNNKRGSIKNRIDRTKIKSNVKERLGLANGKIPRVGGGVQSRLGAIRGSGRGRGRGRGRSGLTRGGGRIANTETNTTSENGQRQGRGGNRGRAGSRGTSRGRGRGRGRGGRGRGRGQGNKTPNVSRLDSDLDNYMSATKS